MAIDFGTSYTTAAAATADQVSMIEVENSRYLPSAVCLDDEGELRTGQLALRLAAQRPQAAERVPKRALTTQSQVRLGSRTFTAVDLVAAVLDRVRSEAVAANDGQPPGRVVLTHPARWGERERGLLGKAAAAAGLPEPELMAEPVAAARYYASRHPVAIDGHVGVYDLGGGTFDAAVVQHTATGFAVAGPPGGDPELGGEDFDQALLDLVGRRAVDADPEPWYQLWHGDDDAAMRARAALTRNAREVKESLTEVTLGYLDVPGYEHQFLVRRHEFTESVLDLLGETVDRFLETVAAAGVAPGDLASVVLAGGASRMPAVSDRIHDRTGLLASAVNDPKGVVVMGAALPADTARPAPEQRRRPRDAPRFFTVRNPFDS
ncbi:Hsp70 family protein [Phytohabitans flavus]|uniref:Hsp70 family protein n=1 Tax=Phytohabitans flavus TaxID=1076124 RepID=UPI003645D8C1